MTQFKHIDDKFKFGKFSGCTLGEVLTFNPEYVDWVVKNVSGRICRTFRWKYNLNFTEATEASEQ